MNETGLLFYEDTPVGLSFETDGIVVTDSHVIQFAGLAGDFFPLHMDDEFARSLGFPGRVAHGLLGLILLDGLKNRAGQRFAAIASLAWHWNFRAPMFSGDRVYGTLRVAEKRLTSRGDRGILTLAMELRNGSGEVLQDGTNLLMVRRRDSTAEVGSAAG